MKKYLSLLLCLILGSMLFGCAAGETEPLESSETTLATAPPTQTTQATQATEETQPPIPEGMVCLDDVIAGSDILLSVDGEKILLNEDGLELELSTDSTLGYRAGYVMVALRRNPVLIEGKVYLEERFCRNILGADEREKASLFYGMPFLAEEILTAIDQPEMSQFNRKLFAEVARPGSMGIDIPYINMFRYFHTNSLSDYPDIIKAEFEKLGYGHAITYTYGEYEVMTGAKMMDPTLIKQAEDLYPELEGVNLWGLTEAEYKNVIREVDRENGLNLLTEEEIAFAQEKQIDLDDLLQLRKMYYGQYMNQPDEVLKAALEEYYRVNLGYLESAAGVE